MSNAFFFLKIFIGGDQGEEDCQNKIDAGFPTLRRLGRWFALTHKILRCVCGSCACGACGACVCGVGGGGYGLSVGFAYVKYV